MNIIILGRYLITFLMCFTPLIADVSVNRDNLYTHVKVLTNTPLPRNFTNLESLDSAAQYISDEFCKSGYDPIEQKFIVRGKEYKNIIARVGPANRSKIVVGAHYDVCGDQHGADDNASGVAGLLEIARILKENEKRLSKQIELVAYSLEEPPFFNTNAMGSYVHAAKLKNDSDNVKFMISLEMIGYYSDEKIQDYPAKIAKLFFPSKANFILLLGHKESKREIRALSRIYKKHASIKSRRMIAFNNSKVGALSDHISYRRLGYKAFMITDTSGNRNKNLHRRNDTIKTLDFEKMSEVVKGVALFLMIMNKEKK